MKPYQVYEIRHFPELKEGQPAQTEQQMTLWGENEEIVTHVSLLSRNFGAGFDLLSVDSHIPVRQIGYIRFPDQSSGDLIKQEFTEYIRPVDFWAFIHRSENIVLFEAPKDVCRGVLKNLNDKSGDIALLEREVDFTRIPDYVEEFSGGWFRLTSTRW